MHYIGSIVSGPSPVCPDPGDPGKGIHKQGAVKGLDCLGWWALVAHSIPVAGAALLWTPVCDVLGSSDGAAPPDHPTPAVRECCLCLCHGHAGLQKGTKHMAEDWGDKQDAHLGSNLDVVLFILVMNPHSDILSGNSAPFTALLLVPASGWFASE